MNADPATLLGPRGQELLAILAAAPDSGSLALATRLRQAYPSALVAAAMTQQDLRRAAAAKFSRAAGMLFTRAGYEQSSSEQIAKYRAARLTGASKIADLCCGIGGDLIALASASEVLAVDRDETHARLALHNAAVYGRAENVSALVADVREINVTGIDAIFIDPARRAGLGTASAQDARRYKAGTSQPPLDWCTALTDQVSAVCIKAAPGLPEDLIPKGWEAEFIAEGRDLKEAVLWSPSMVTAPEAGERGPRRATVIAPATPGDAPQWHTIVAREGDPVALRQPGEYLLDPSPAVTRAGLVADLARSLGDDTAKIDPQIAFLTLDRNAETPFARTLKVQHSAPWTEKSFAKRLHELEIGTVDIRRRGLAGDVDQIRRRLKLAGSRRATLVITRVNNRPWGLICTDA